MVDPKLLGWLRSPSGTATIQLKGGFLRYGVWQNGEVLLVPPKSVGVEVRGFVRPSVAAISDEGFAVVADWLSVGSKANKLRFIRPDGTISREHRLAALVFNIVLEPAERIVFVSTAAGGSGHAKILAYTLSDGQPLWSKPSPKPAAELRVIPEQRCVLVGRPYTSCGSDYLERVAYDGKVLDRWPDSPYEALSLGMVEKQAGRFSEAHRWLQIAAESDIPPSYRAQALRALGEVAEATGDISGALSHYETAMALNPGIGLKRRIAALNRGGHK
jgi:tetratricopeptide (TPR) repeat protein